MKKLHDFFLGWYAYATTEKLFDTLCIIASFCINVLLMIGD